MALHIHYKVRDKEEAWITVHGAKVLVKEGKIVAGAGGKLNGKKEGSSSASKGSSSQASTSSVFGKEVHAAVKSKFSAKEKSAIASYSSDKTDPKKGQFKPAYQEINQNLRNGANPPAHLKKTVAQMDEVFASASTEKAIKVYRGLDDDFANQLSEGASFTDGGFVSTTSEKSIASEFSGKSKTVMEINVPKGSKAISVAGVSEYENEQEVLLNRGGSFKVTGISEADGKRIVHVEYAG